MRSFIRSADEDGIGAVVDQQFELAHQILGAGLIPIIEPEIDINSPEKAKAEAMLKASILTT
jgi:fructose-bisphosphate aldolase, class I